MSKIVEDRQFCYLEKGVLELHRAATIKPRKIECSVFFLLDHNGQAQVYRLVSGQLDERLWRKRDFPMKDDDCAPALTRVKSETTEHLNITSYNDFCNHLNVRYF